MIVRSVSLKHFGRFDEAAFTFAGGLNLVSGPNEAGKSTLMEAIPAVLFGVRDKDRFRPWGRDGSCSAQLELASPSGQRVVIEREILSDRVTLTEFDAHGSPCTTFEGKVAPLGRSSEKAGYLQQLEKFLGHADEALFRASLFFSQGSMEIDAPEEATTRIKSILSGCGEVDYDRVLVSLSDDYFAITRDNPWGKDKAKDRELETIQARIKELEAQWYATKSRTDNLVRLRLEIATLKERLDKKRADVAEGTRYLDWIRRQSTLDEKEDALRRDFSRVQQTTGKLEALHCELSDLQRELKLIGLPLNVPEQLPQLLADAEGIRKTLISLQEAGIKLRREQAALGTAPWKSAIFFSSLVLALCGLLGKGEAFYLACGGVASAVVWGFFLYRLFNLNAARAALDGQLDQIVQRREAAQAEMAEIEEVLQFNGLPCSAVDIVKMEKNLERHRSLIARIKEIESAISVLDRSEILNGEQASLTRELAILAERKEQDRPVRAAGIKPADLPDLEAKLRALTEQIAQGEGELLELIHREAALAAESGEVRDIEEEGETLREREAVLLRRKAALSLGYDLLRSTVDEFRHSYLDLFSNEISQYLAFVTRNRYDAVKLDQDFAPWVKVRGDEWQEVRRLSRGAQDAVYLGIRLALTRHLTRGRHLPLLLDDPFVHLDRVRLGEALKLLERVADEHQIIVFSHSDDLLRRARTDRWQVVALEGRSAIAHPSFVPKPKLKEKVSDEGQQLSFL